MRTIVINNREGLVQGQMPHVGKDASGAPMPGMAITLLPGVNLVDSETLATLRKNPAFERNFTTKIEKSLAPEQNPECVGKFILEVDKTVGKGGEVADDAPLAKLPPEQCRAVISETFDVAMLRRWLTEDGRADVRRDVQNQIDKISAAPKAAGR